MAASAWGLDTPTRDHDWRLDAACTPDTAELFYITNHVRGPHAANTRRDAALAICHTCPVRAECYADAAAHPDRDGWRIAGGAVWEPTSARGRKAGAAASGTAVPVQRRPT